MRWWPADAAPWTARSLYQSADRSRGIAQHVELSWHACRSALGEEAGARVGVLVARWQRGRGRQAVTAACSDPLMHDIVGSSRCLVIWCSV